MVNFKKVLNLKLISLIISIQFLFNTTLYSYTISNDSLRIPIGQTQTYRRVGKIVSDHTQPTFHSAKPWTGRFIPKFHRPIATSMLFMYLSGTPDSAGSILWAERQAQANKPIITEVIKPNQENLSQLLTQLGYPEKAHPLLIKEFNEFLSEINFAKLQKELAAIKESNDQAGLSAFLEKLIQKVRDLGYANPKQPKKLLKLLVNSLYGEDILNLLEEANIPGEKKRQLQEDFFSCVPLSQLADILLRLMGFEVKDTVAPEHVSTLIIALVDNQFLLVDFSLGLIMPLNLQQIYEVIGEQKKYWILKQEFYIDSGNWRLTSVLMKIKQQIIEKKFDLQVLLRSKELSEQDKLRLVLNAFYFCIHITDSKSLKFSIYHHFGTVLAELGRLDEAIKAYNEAIQCNPDYAEAHYDLGTTLVELGRIDEAIKAYNEAIRLNPTYAEPYYNLGVIHLKLGDQDEGIKSLVKAVRLKPDLLNLLPEEIKNEVIKNLSLNQLEIDKKLIKNI